MCYKEVGAVLPKVLENKALSRGCLYTYGLWDPGKGCVNSGPESQDITQGQLHGGAGVSTSPKEAAWRGPWTQNWDHV